MIDAGMAAWVFAALLGLVSLFQLALAAGAPWGALAMGGRYPGRLPPPMRAAAVVQVGIYALMGAVVLSRAGVTLQGWFEVSRVAVWVVVGVSALAALLNLITPSKWERRIWVPVALLMLAAVIRVALAD